MTSSEALQTKSYSRIVSRVNQSHQSESNMRSDYKDGKQDANKCVFNFVRKMEYVSAVRTSAGREFQRYGATT